MKIIALDAGGTSAKFALYDEQGTVLAKHNFTTPHILEVGVEKLCAIVKTGVDYCCAQLSEPEPFILSIGMAAFGRDQQLATTIKMALSKDYEHLLLHGDMEIAYKAAFPANNGILLIAGTGSIAYAQEKSKVLRTGGFGYFLGDEGSAYWISRKALQLFTKQVDGRFPKTELYSFVKKSLALDDDYAIISQSLSMTRSEIANLCASLINLYNKDKLVTAIYDEAINELASLVQALAKQLVIISQPIEVALVGGVFNEALLREMLQGKLGTFYKVQFARHEPVYGAYLYANEYIAQQLNEDGKC